VHAVEPRHTQARRSPSVFCLARALTQYSVFRCFAERYVCVLTSIGRHPGPDILRAVTRSAVRLCAGGVRSFWQRIRGSQFASCPRHSALSTHVGLLQQVRRSEVSRNAERIPSATQTMLMRALGGPTWARERSNRSAGEILV
jgi:hypothetical protein